MSDSPLVSVIVPIYNRAELAQQAIDSVLAQTFTDYEIIVVDDGSTDQTRAVVTAYGEPVRYVYQANQDVSVARNHGMRLARGRYIAFLDSDDRFHPEKLALQVACLKANPDVVMVYTAYRFVRSDGMPIHTMPVRPTDDMLRQILFESDIETTTVMLRTDVVRRVGEFDPRISLLQDMDYWARVALHGKIVGLPQPLVDERLHGGNKPRDPDVFQHDWTLMLAKHFTPGHELGWLFERRTYAHMHYMTGNFCLAWQPPQLIRAYRHWLRGLWRWPVDRLAAILGLRLLFRTVMPGPLQQWLRRFLRRIRQ